MSVFIFAYLHTEWSHSWLCRVTLEKRGIQRALRQTIGRRRLRILVIEGCCFGSESTLHNQCFGLCGCGGHGLGSYPWLQNGIWHADTDWGVSPPENPDATAARVCELLLRGLSSPAYLPPSLIYQNFLKNTQLVYLNPLATHNPVCTGLSWALPIRPQLFFFSLVRTVKLSDKS